VQPFSSCIRLFATPQEQQELAEKYRAGGFGYGQAKQMLYEKIEQYFAAARQRRRELAKEPGLVEEVLRQGAARARAEARATMALVRRAVGLNPPP
jgi:tryptophanyl-tRNA synthetase